MRARGGQSSFEISWRIPSGCPINRLIVVAVVAASDEIDLALAAVALAAAAQQRLAYDKTKKEKRKE